MPRTTSTSESNDAPASRESASTRSGRHRLTIAAVAATGLTFAALLWAQHCQGSDASTPAVSKSSAAPSVAASSAAAQTPDPLTDSATPDDGDAKKGDNTGKSRVAAARTLSEWNADNPAATGEHAVGGKAGSGPGGRIGEVLRIPALGKDWAQPVYDGVGDKQLRAGVGHFPTTEQPGQIGNFALAGHRSGVADPAFRNIDRIKTGALIQVTTAHRITYTYTVTRVHTVAPTDVDVIAQVPGRPDATPTKAKLTLVTCWPATGHSRRVVVEADLASAKGGA
ncbi:MULTISPECIES: sortase [Streptomyces]|uniref:Sortase n=1 Tax=Streptomyces griseiscabiei TaxID=2993540 RepID=A0ABU4LDX3_9ACTN|nr:MULTISPECIES: sortase [Streptomyces]MBZ3908468.1 class E sortase [Streptomyces griseiscabiei]MDX2913986.1 sortase [Streptomyces griseiscabiei]